MGLDRFANFISKSINNEGLEEIYLENNIRKIVSNHIIFDINFLIYQEILEIENEINDIIKIILCLPFSINIENNILEEHLKYIFDKNHWKINNLEQNLEKIFDGFNEDEIINNLKKFLNKKNTNNLSIIELVIFEKIFNVIIKYIIKLHDINLIHTIALFFDGIPSFSKIIEQRKRRIKNFLESNEKKILFKDNFNNLETNNTKLIDKISINNNLDKSKYDNLLFDYFKWIKHRFSIDKSIGPSSNFIIFFETFILNKLKDYFKKIKIYINSAKENGESDLKIFKYIAEINNLDDYCIHTIDSDLIHQILVQQTYYIIINKNITLTVAKYIKNYNSIGYLQIIEANLIIKKILELYYNINNIQQKNELINNYKIIWDLCLIFYFFGNDHLPASIEIGPELGLEYYLKCHYNALNTKNIINLKIIKKNKKSDDKNNLNIDLLNLNILLKYIYTNNSNNITKIILQRFFKINFNLINLFIDILNLNFTDILDLLKYFINYKANIMSKEEFNNLDKDDLRVKYKNVQISENYNKLKLNILIDNIILIENNIDYCETNFNGLILYNKPFNINNDNYQTLYNYISEKAVLNISNQYPEYYDHINIYEHLKILKFNNNYNELQYIKECHELVNIIYDPFNNNNNHIYLKKIYHLVLTQFGNMENYHSDNITYYSDIYVPNLKNLINYIDNILNNNNNYMENILKEIKNENINNNYFNSINHYLIITPFILNYNLPQDILKIIKEIKEIDNLWFNNNNLQKFKYKKINIKNFFINWNNVLINNYQKSNKINNLEYIIY
jgi:hypothetical protein